MALGAGTKTKASKGKTASAWAWLALIVPSASCVPAGLTAAPDLSLGALAQPAPDSLQPAAAAPDAAPTPGLAALFGNPAYAANAAIPVAGGLNPAAPAFIFRAGTALDSLRSLDCLAQAVYYESRSESEDGQRAVAQVVLNRVRHPAWPNSVCGVVYQGPMRAGGGCQFTFTCDGSLARRPEGVNWARARAIAAEALAGRIHWGVGTSTHYHTSAVFPAWAPRLVKTAVIGAHNFYRLPGLGGAPGAFVANYTGSEPLPRAAMTLARATPAPLDFGALAPATPAEIRAAATMPSDIPQQARWTAGNLPESTIREEYRESGQWRDDAPAAMTGAR